MKNNALYPGTFDPITYGHIDVIKKALKIVDRVIIAVSENSNKNYLFDINERLNIINKALFKDLKMKSSKIKIISFNSLTTDLCKKMNAKIILRGLRAVSDFEYEFQLAGMNRKLNNDIETIFQSVDITIFQKTRTFDDFRPLTAQSASRGNDHPARQLGRGPGAHQGSKTMSHSGQLPLAVTMGDPAGCGHAFDYCSDRSVRQAAQDFHTVGLYDAGYVSPRPPSAAPLAPAHQPALAAAAPAPG